MSFDTFLNTIIKLAVLVFPNKDARQASDSFIQEHIRPLYGMIMKATIIGDVNELVNSELLAEELRPFLEVDSD